MDSLYDLSDTGIRIDRAGWCRDGERLRALRRRVFVEEQAVPPALEDDGEDMSAEHFVASDANAQLLGTARLLASGRIGRLAVLPEWRRRGIGRRLLEAAVMASRERGDSHVSLHAQHHARDFYARAGFEPIDAPFMEAGIAHQRMVLDFALAYEPPAAAEAYQVVNPQAPQPTTSARHARKDRAAPSRALEGPDALREAMAALIQHAKRTLLVFSPDLAPPVLDAPEIADALSAFARSSPQAEGRLLIHDGLTLARRGHRLLALARCLPSSIDIRVAHPQMRTRNDLFAVADARGVVFAADNAAERGAARFNAPALACGYGDVFHRLWQRSGHDRNLRQQAL